MRFLVDYSQNFDMKDDYKRFFRKDNFDSDIEEIFNKTFYEFPIFSMNEPYLKALGSIIAIKVKRIYNIQKQTLDIVDKVIHNVNLRESVGRSDLEEISNTQTLERDITNYPSKGIGLTIVQRQEAQNKITKYKVPKYKPTLTKWAEKYLIPKSNTTQISMNQNKYYDKQRNMSKCIQKMWKSFTKYNNRLSKWESFLALKGNAFKFKAARKLLELVDRVVKYHYVTTKNKKEFFEWLVKNVEVKKRMNTLNINNTAKYRMNENILNDSNEDLEEMEQEINNYNEFYNQNMKMKAFYTLIRYKKKKIKLRIQEEEESNSIQKFKLQKFFQQWRRAFTHRINQLENRKCFKVKFSDYCKCTDWMKEQIEWDIKPEFDKFTNNPYPRVASMINTSRIQEDDSGLLNISKSSHPFSKYANPLTRININPVWDESREVVVSDWTIKTIEDTSFNPFNKVGVKEVISIGSLQMPNQERNIIVNNL